MLGPLASRRPALATAALLALGAVVGVLTAGAAAGAETCGRVRFVAVYDSHGLTPFGDRLDALLLARPAAELQSYTLGGASPAWLLHQQASPRGYAFNSCEGKPLVPRSRLPKRDLRTPVLEDVLRVPEGAYERQVVVLTLGSNVPGEPSVLSAPVESIVRTVNARTDATCVWVGPPSNRSFSAAYSDKVYEAIREGIRAAEVGQKRRGPACHLLDSRRFSTYPAGGDGVHYAFTPSGIAAAYRWADGIAGEIDRLLQAPP